MSKRNEVSVWADEAMFRAQSIDRTSGPRVFLLSCNPDPLGSIAACAKAYIGEFVEDLSQITDDGLQHYRLPRCVELAVFDLRGAGNGHLLPAGPLREPLDRLQTVTALVCNGGMVDLPELSDEVPRFSMRLFGQRFVALGNPLKTCAAEDLKGKKLYALAGIGDPSRFFLQLDGLGLEFSMHPFPDHRQYCAEDLAFAHDGVLLMTEKDAVKCRGLTLPETWVLPVDAHIEENSDGASLLNRILEKLNGCASA